ncbi:hypothetical protein NQ317_006319, partial [Molorchus minor]
LDMSRLSIVESFNDFHTALYDVISELDDPPLMEEDLVRAHFEEIFYSIEAVYVMLFPRSILIFQLRKKSGKIKEWPAFIDLYNVLVHNNNELSDVEKYQYLLTSLKDDPLGIVKGIPLLGPNYSIAYATLCKRYQSKRIQCTHSWNEIINSTKIDSENPQRLRHLLDLFEENLVKRFELHYSPSDPARDIPTYHDLTKFLEKQCASLDSAALMNEQSTSKCKQHSYVKQSDFPHISNLKLADGTFNKPGPVDILLGADVFSLILQNGRIAGSTPDEPIAINTVFGWIVMDEILKSFWEIEQVPNKPSISVEDSLCEKIYQDTVSRNASVSSPYLALRTIKQLVKDEGLPYPRASETLLEASYVDDICSGTADIQVALETQSELISLLSKGGFVLRKWASNHPALLRAVDSEDCQQELSFDSVLSWVKSSPHRWKQFVANRVAQIQEKICPAFWHYIPSLNNPADCASRGIFPSQLVNHSQWWAGPDFFYSSINIDFFDEYESPECPEEIKPFVLTSLTDTDSISDLLNKWSSLSKIKRILSYCLRFIASCRKQRADSDYITSVEMHNAVITLAKVTQKEFFSQEILNLKRSRPLIKPLRRLNPFLDDSGVIRVGGRLRHSSLDYPTKHPILLPRQSRLTELLVEEVHRDNFHPGLQTTHFCYSKTFGFLVQNELFEPFSQNAYDVSE